MSDEKLAYEYINKAWPNKGPCLTPLKESVTKNSSLLISHENDYCQCDLMDTFLAGIRIGHERGLKKHLCPECEEKFTRKDLDWCYGCQEKYAGIIGEKLDAFEIALKAERERSKKLVEALEKYTGTSEFDLAKQALKEYEKEGE